MSRLLWFFVIFAILLPAAAFAQIEQKWQSVYAGTYTRNSAAVAVDATGNVYAAITPNPSDGATRVVKFSPSGAALWTATIAGCTAMRDIKIDSGGNALALGYALNAFILVKLSSSGTEIWRQTMPGALNTVSPRRMAIDGSDRTTFVGTSSDFSGTSMWRICRVDSAGTILWSHDYALTGYPSSVAVTPSGRCGVAGHADSKQHVIILDEGGATVFQETLDPTVTGYGTGVDFDSTGNLYASFWRDNTVTWQAEAVVRKWNPAGALLWQASISSPTVAYGAYSICALPGGGAAITGNALPPEALFTAKVSTTGVVEWTNLFATGTSAVYHLGLRILPDTLGNTYVLAWEADDLVSSSRAVRLVKYSPGGQRLWNGPGIVDGTFALPYPNYSFAHSHRGMDRDAQGNLYTIGFDSGLQLVVNKLGDPSVVNMDFPGPVAAGGSVNAIVNLLSAAPPSGTTVNLSCPAPGITIPASVVVPGGAAFVSFNVAAAASVSVNKATITATIPGSSISRQINVVPNNNSTFASQGVYTSMIAGQTYGATIRFTNTGQSTWSSANGYSARPQNPVGNTTWGTTSLAISGSVTPGALGVASGYVYAPTTPGTYNLQWRMTQTNVGDFGGLSTNVAVVVTAAADAARYLSRTGPTTVNAGADFYIQNIMRNVGTNSWSHATGYSMMTVTPNNDPKWTNTRAYMPTSTTVAPNAQVTFTSLVTAPITPGVYTMQWQMNKTGTPFGDKSPLLNITVNASADNAQYISQTGVPLSVGPGVAFSGVFTMKNVGSATWDGTYSLVPQGAQTWGNAGNAVTGTIAPNANAVFNANFTAPATPGTYTFQRRMAHNATKFGQGAPVLSIVVSADAAQYISRTGATTVNAGADFYIQNVFKNTGTTSWSTATGYAIMTVNPNNNTTWTATRGYLASGTIAPAANGTFTALCTAPITPGAYTMQWRMSKSGVPFGENSPLLNMTVVASANNAQFISQTGIPTTVAANGTFNATITMKNVGSATWGAGYTLNPTGSIAWGVASINAPATAPNANAVFNQTFTAPATPGTYTFRMRMQQGATKFGQSTTLVTITVT